MLRNVPNSIFQLAGLEDTGDVCESFLEGFVTLTSLRENVLNPGRVDENTRFEYRFGIDLQAVNRDEQLQIDVLRLMHRIDPF